MKKKLGVLIGIILVLSLFILPNVNAEVKKGDTLRKLRGQLQELKDKKTAQNNAKNKTKAEIAQTKQNIKNTEYEIGTARDNIEALNKEIADSNAKIADLKEDTEDLLRLYQELQSENVYASYVTGASSMTELIMRLDAINQVTDYNEKKLNELELLIETNDKLSVELKKHQEKLSANILTYEKLLDDQTEALAELDEGVLTIDQEISAMRELIKYYESKGCKEDQDLIECVNIANNTGWLKPVSKGVITSVVGYRKSPTAGASSNHKGIDIGIRYGTPVYPTANGQVAAIIRNASCGGNMLYIWTYVNGKKYTYVYMHLSEILVKVGDEVRVDKVVAKSGGRAGGSDRCTTGPHLHYGLSEGHHFGAAGDKPLSKFNAYIISPPGFPGKGGSFSNRY